MRIGILRETKTPIDNRVALTPDQISHLSQKYPEAKFIVQSSQVRAYQDEEYIEKGIEVRPEVDDCDILFGIKEAAVDTLLPNKHYIFFGHIAKKQRYNIPLFKRLLDLRTTFSDYEYIVGDDGLRLVAFGWYAGVVGVYYTLMGWGLKTGAFTLPMPHHHFTIEEIINNLKKVDLSNIKIVLTGNGRVSHGAQHILKEIGASYLNPEEFLNQNDSEKPIYTVLGIEDLVTPISTDKVFDRNDFLENPTSYRSDFLKYAKSADIFISCHFWNNDQPVYLEKDDFTSHGFRLKVIGDITCDIQGSIKSTLRSSTHSDPFYDYNPHTQKEEPAFSDKDNITVMAVDTCPNALPRVTSQYFGEKLIEFVLDDLLRSNTDQSKILNRATIIKDGHLTPEFNYLSDYVKSFSE